MEFFFFNNEIILKKQCAHDTTTTNKCHMALCVPNMVHRFVDMYHGMLFCEVPFTWSMNTEIIHYHGLHQSTLVFGYI